MSKLLPSSLKLFHISHLNKTFFFNLPSMSQCQFRFVVSPALKITVSSFLLMVVVVYRRYAVGSPRTNGLFLNGSHPSKSNGVMKLSNSMPGNYSILTSSDLLVGMHSATGSPRAKGISASS